MIFSLQLIPIPLSVFYMLCIHCNMHLNNTQRVKSYIPSAVPLAGLFPLLDRSLLTVAQFRTIPAKLHQSAILNLPFCQHSRAIFQHQPRHLHPRNGQRLHYISDHHNPNEAGCPASFSSHSCGLLPSVPRRATRSSF